MDAAAKLRELAKPKPESEKAVDTISRVAALVGMSHSRAYEIWYGRARRIEPDELARINDAIALKDRREIFHDIQALRAALDRIEARISAADPELDRADLHLARAGARATR
jgi:hypothetical protein